MRPSIIHNKFSLGYGGHIGVTRYFGADIKTKFIGNNDEQTVDSYKSFTYIPVLLDINFYYNLKRSNIFLGIEAGCNIMLGQRDCHLKDGGIVRQINDTTFIVDNSDGVISVQQDANKVSVTRVIPTGRVMLGYMYELNQDFKIRAQVGVEYQMKYKDSFSGYYNDADAGYIDSFHKGDQPAAIYPFATIGLVYSL
jgi:long-subunit fatty acid transport protein